MKAKLLILAAILTLGAVVRFNGLGAKSVNFDEAVSLSFLDRPVREILDRTAEPPSVHPPLPYLLIHYWSNVAGGSDGALRCLAAACGVASIVGVYLLVAELGRLPGVTPAPAAAPLAAALVALSPIQVLVARQVRGYSLAAALVLFGGWALTRAVRGAAGAAAWWGAAAVLGLAACYSEYPAIPSVISEWLFAAVYLGVERRKPGTSTTGMVGGAPSFRGRAAGPIAAAVLVSGFAAPWSGTLAKQIWSMRHDVNQPITFRGACAQVTMAFTMTYQTPTPYPAGTAIVAAVVPILALSLVWLGWRGGWRGRFLAVTGIVPVLIMIALSIGSNRSFLSAKHLAFCQPLWLAGIAVLVASIRAPLERAAAVAWVLALSLFAAYGAWDVIGPGAKPGMRAAVRTILERRRPDEPVVTNNPFMFFGLRRYARGRAEPRLLAAATSRRALRCSEHLWNDQLLMPTRLVGTDPAGVWVLRSGAYPAEFSTPFDKPASWDIQDSWVFEQDYFIEYPLTVEYYRCRPLTSSRPPAREIVPGTARVSAFVPGGESTSMPLTRTGLTR